MRITLGFMVLFLCQSMGAMAQENCDSIMQVMFEQWEKIDVIQYHSKKIERQKDKVDIADFDFTIQRSPFKVAGKMTEKGHRILYQEDFRPSEALYISNGFPYTNLWLDINGTVFRGLNHYTISDAGSEFVFDIMNRLKSTTKAPFLCSEVTRKGKAEYLFEASTNAFKWTVFTPKENQTLLELAEELSVSAYLVLERNDLNSYDQVVGGMKLEVPNFYGKSVRIYIDKKVMLPSLIEIEDERGVFERYEYTDFVLNSKLPEDFFTEEFLDALD